MICISTACTIATYIVHSKLDYCNSLYTLSLNYPVSSRSKTLLPVLSLKFFLSYHCHPTLSSLAQDPEHIKYKLLSLTYKVLTTTQPPYLHKLISTQRPRSTRSSYIITLARPPSSSSLKIIDHSFRYASPCLWNQLPLSLRQPHFGTSSSISDSLYVYIYNSLSHSRLKTYLFHKS